MRVKNKWNLSKIREREYQEERGDKSKQKQKQEVKKNPLVDFCIRTKNFIHQFLRSTKISVSPALSL